MIDGEGVRVDRCEETRSYSGNRVKERKGLGASTDSCQFPSSRPGNPLSPQLLRIHCFLQHFLIISVPYLLMD